MTFMFGPWKLNPSEVFYLTERVMCFVNLKPVVPGHVLISPRRICPKLADLDDAELQELWRVAAVIAPRIQREFGGTGVTYALQDGPTAGQTVPHVHIHVLPRRAGDFDESRLSEDSHNGVRVDPSSVREEQRSRTAMAQEALQLRSLFCDSLPIQDS
mmetsp:Transcript_13218/g.26839  ORF Transcript_13218/g.26839 Transcript_13218/m.26839 type:complete len:158 (+) Transcript_13218:1795-2268(+)